MLHKSPDFASRYPQNDPEDFLKGELCMAEEIEVAIHGEVSSAWNESGIDKISWQMVKMATNSDPDLSAVRNMLENEESFDVKDCPPAIKQFARYWDSLYVQDGVILMGTRTVIPGYSYTRVLESLHASIFFIILHLKLIFFIS